MKFCIENSGFCMKKKNCSPIQVFFRSSLRLPSAGYWTLVTSYKDANQMAVCGAVTSKTSPPPHAPHLNRPFFERDPRARFSALTGGVFLFLAAFFCFLVRESMDWFLGRRRAIPIHLFDCSLLRIKGAHTFVGMDNQLLHIHKKAIGKFIMDC